MAQIFHRSTNTLSRLSIFGAIFVLAGLAWLAAAINRSSYVTRVSVARDQPVPFSHEHHVRSLGLDCRNCHTAVEESAFAGIPPTKTCMTCHSQIWSDSSMLEPIRASLRTGVSIQWTRVHDLPDFVRFNHSIHLARGVGCSTCHGQVDQMPLLWQTATLQMEWCLDCHRAPEKYVRPRDQVFNMDWRPPADQLVQGRQLVKEYGIQNQTDCSICHR